MSNVFEVLLRLLSEAGVQHIFGVPGDAINELTEAIRTQNKIRFIHVAHEESGGFAAVGQAKLTGRLGVCAGTAGPGAIHLLNALYDAKCDRVPVLAITGQVATSMLGSSYQQEVDLISLFNNVTVYNQMVTNPENFACQAAQAIQTAIERSGVAHLNIPLDVAAKTVPHADRWRLHLPYRNVVQGNREPVLQAIELLNQSDRVVILAGLGCNGAAERVYTLAERLYAPVIHALRAKELFPESHPYSIGGLGMLGVKPAMKAIERCDALIMIGTNFPYADFLPRHAKIIQIDLDPCQLGKHMPVDIAIAGDSGAVIDKLLERLEPKTDKRFLQQMQDETKRWKEQVQREVTDLSVPIKPQRLAHLIGELATENAIFVCDTGEVTAWAARYLSIKAGQRFIISGMLATMAFSLGAAIGAKLAYPKRQVIAITGDGGFTMLMADFATAVRYGLAIVFVIFNNKRLGMIRIEQEARGMPETQTSLHNPDFAAFARACGGDGMQVTEAQDLENAITQGMKSAKPFIVDVVIDETEKIIPPHIKLSQAANYSIAKIKEIL
ncbi:MAG TPA: thiamine pyrophosphate-dependent enzyme [Rickettsiales bacterium]|nr:thiamine pyrophosphate-dependent enzyme [Rickettsiales bacterium]